MTDTSTVAAYLDAYQRLIVAHSKVQELGDKISETAYLLADCWSREGGPCEIASIDLNRHLQDWPTQHDLSNAVSHFSAVCRELHEAWDRIPADFNVGLMPPSKLLQKKPENR